MAAGSTHSSGLGLFEADTAEDFWSGIEQRRQQGDVVWDDEIGGWLVFPFELIKELSLQDNDVWRSLFVPDPARHRLGMDVEQWVDFIGPSPRSLALLEGPEYDQAHRWYFRALSPKVLARWGETLIEPIAHAQIDRFAADGRADLCADYADRMASRAVASILGLPADDEFIELVVGLHRRRTALIEHHLAPDPDPELLAGGIEARRQLTDILMPYVNERASGDGDDLISMIWRDGETIFGEGFGEVEVASTAATLLGSGSGTTAAAVGNALYLTLTQPGLDAEVRAGGTEAIRHLGEEALRLHGPVQVRFRWAKRDTVLGGIAIKEGDLVLPVSAAGNRDPEHYPHPDRVDLERRAPRDHLGFSLGPRTCPGQSLARFQLERILSVAFERLHELRLDPDAEPPGYAGQAMRRWKPLHVLFASA